MGLKESGIICGCFLPKGPINKSKIMLLIADKKMAEAKALIDNSPDKNGT